MQGQEYEKPSEKTKKWLKALSITVAVLIVLRLLLPFIVLRYTNSKLAEMKGYYGHISDIDIALIRGAYEIEIRNGRVRYLDESSHPPVDIQLSELQVITLNLKNSYDSSSLLPAHVGASAKVYEGELDFEMDLNPLADEPTFDMNSELKNTNLVLLNDFFQAYAKIDVNKGTFGMYTEVAAKDGPLKDT